MRAPHALVIATTIAATLVLAPPASAGERACDGRIGATTIDDDIHVPAGATCRLVGTRVEGNVVVGDGATLVAVRVDVGGNVQAEDHRRVVVRRSSVDGDVQLDSGGGAVLRRNDVGGDIQLFGNDGRIVVRANRVDGNLQCKENTPAPRGGRNVVQGDKEDQCRRL